MTTPSLYLSSFPSPLSTPFEIPSIPKDGYGSIYQISLDIRFPLLASISYTTIISLLSKKNQTRSYKPWAISKSRFFHHFVVLHNLLLAIYSAWTVAAVYNIIHAAIPSSSDPSFTVRTTDLLCRGSSHIIPSGYDTQAFERNLYFVGWLFYVSKVYEMVDTMIILAKGRSVSRLHLYHHSGVIFCSWALIRFRAQMSMILLFLNAFIHALMYSYYTLTAIRVPVIGWIKASLTALQITQFIIGAILTVCSMYLRYDIPLSSNPSLSSTMLRNSTPLDVGIDSLAQEYATTASASCFENSGQVYASMLGVVFLFPLFYMFARFFVKSYLTSCTRKASSVGAKLRADQKEEVRG